MSGNEYTFHARRKNITNPSMPNPLSAVKDVDNVKDIIMGQYDHFEKLKKSDEHVKYLINTREKISKEITESFNQFQKSVDNETRNQLHNKLNYLTELHKKLEKEYTEMMTGELTILHQRWPDICTKIIEGIDRATLENVLTVFEDYKTGKMSSSEAVITGMDYMTDRYHLPSDFFDKSAVDQFNKNLHKLS
jgi:hypothetical protein